MDLVSKFIESNSSELIESLKGSGFSLDQARQFLPEAATGIADVVDELGVEELVAGFASGQQDKLLSLINIEGIASKLGIDASQVTSGFESIVPVLTGLISQGGSGLGGVISSLAGGSTGGLLSSAKKLLG